jgi:hypothetical protein
MSAGWPPRFLDRDLDFAVVERTLAQHLAEFLAGIGARIVPDQRIEDAPSASSALA